MPSKGINFSQAKPWTASLSINPRTAATRKWENDLSGLSLALHRVNKAATVARGHAITKVKKESLWIHASQEIHDKMIQEAVDEVNRNCDVKRQEARDKWRAMHAEEKDEVEGNESVGVNSEGGSHEGEDEMSEEDVSESVSEGESEAEYSEEDSDDSDEEEGSEAEEVDEEDEGDGLELTEEQREALNDRLLTLRTKQGQEYESFIGTVEAQAKSRKGKETPDDYKFGA